jgi:hypothetical protein
MQILLCGTDARLHINMQTIPDPCTLGFFGIALQLARPVFYTCLTLFCESLVCEELGLGFGLDAQVAKIMYDLNSDSDGGEGSDLAPSATGGHCFFLHSDHFLCCDSSPHAAGGAVK